MRLLLPPRWGEPHTARQKSVTVQIGAVSNAWPIEAVKNELGSFQPKEWLHTTEGLPEIPW